MKESFIRFLRYTEKYTKTDMLYLFKGGFWLTFGQIVSSASALITSIAFANLVSPDTFGIYKYILSITSILLISTLSGIDSAITQSVSRGFEGTMNEGMRVKIKWGILGSLLSLITASYYFLQGNNVLSLSLGIVAIFIPFIESFDVYNSLLFGKRKFDTQTKYNVIKKISSFIAIILVILLTKNLYIILFTYFLSSLIPNILFFYITEKKHQSNKVSDPEAMSYGKKLSAIQIIGLVTAELDKIMIFQFIGASELAIYSLAIAPTEQIKGFAKNINSLAIPKFSQKTASEIKNSIKNKILVLTLGSSILITGYILIAPLFFRTFFPLYTQSIIYSQILSISIIGAILSSFLYTVLESQKASGEIYKFNTYGNVLGIIILLPLVLYFGMWGAVISRVITRFCVFVYTAYLVNRLA